MALHFLGRPCGSGWNLKEKGGKSLEIAKWGLKVFIKKYMAEKKRPEGVLCAQVDDWSSSRQGPKPRCELSSFFLNREFRPTFARFLRRVITSKHD
jgi:hypothetical protein